ncbi:MAG: M20/M25/M40 family metallo-hydrolase [Gemmatimonadales bacterium]
MTQPGRPVRAVDEVVNLTSTLIRFDTSNTGELATTKGEALCAGWVAEQLEEVGYRTTQVESGAPGRANVFATLPGADSSRGKLLVHGHLDVVPAEAAEWSVHPFSGAVEDGYVWGRGAIDMKNMVGMMIAVARQFKREGTVPPRDLVFAFVADEEAGGKYGCRWLVENRPDLFEGITEAVGEVGGFSLTVPRRDGGERRLYLIETAEKGMLWMRLTARRRPGHGSFVHDDNAVTAVADAVAKLGRHRFPIVLHDAVAAVPRCRRRRDRSQLRPRLAGSGGQHRQAGLDRAHRRRHPARHRQPDDAAGRVQGQRHPGHRRGRAGLPGAAGPSGRVRAGGRRDHRPRHRARVDHRVALVRNDFRRRSGGGDECRAAGDRSGGPHRALYAGRRDRREALRPPGHSMLRIHPRCACRRNSTSPRCFTGLTNASPWTRCCSARECSTIS